MIISGSTEYRRYQAAAIKQRYAIRFPGVTYGGGALSPRSFASAAGAHQNIAQELEDPDLLSGVVHAPPRLAMEMADLIRFKTSTLTAIGFQRNGVWGEETASQKIEHVGLTFGTLAASRNGAVRGLRRASQPIELRPSHLPRRLGLVSAVARTASWPLHQWEEDMLMVASEPLSSSPP